MESKQWQKLEAVDLWIKCTFNDDSYSIWMTDLCQLYAEELDAEDFRWRATKAKLPIDIDEPANLRTVLKTLSRAVDDGSLNTPSALGKGRVMDLIAGLRLPKPLPNIDWTFKLELQEDDKFREHVSKPLLHRIDGFQQREDDLIERLHDKDHAIDKLLDTLEKYSVDLADVFPSLAAVGAARRAGGRKEAQAHVPALQLFDKGTWLEGMADGKRYVRPVLAERTESGSFESMPSRSASQAKPETEGKHTEESEVPSQTKATSNGIKRKLGGRKAVTPAPTTSDTESEKPSPAPSTPPLAQKSKGIKRTLGSRKPGTATTTSATATDVSDVESKPVSPEKPKGIKRTLGSRKVQAKDRESSPGIPSGDAPVEEEPEVGSSRLKHQTEPEAPEEAIDEDEAADRKRAALKRQFATAAGSKTKKRKF